MFGKPFVEYVRFARAVLLAILVIGVVRLGLSLAGVPVGIVKVFSVTVVLLAGVLYLGAAAARGFGGYRHLLPLVFFPALLANVMAAAAIGLAALTGRTNVYAAPEYSNLPNYLPHAAGHLAGTLVVTLGAWGLASLAMLVTRMVRGGAPAGARA